jgi:hypothetical protein
MFPGFKGSSVQRFRVQRLKFLAADHRLLVPDCRRRLAYGCQLNRQSKAVESPSQSQQQEASDQ